VPQTLILTHAVDPEFGTERNPQATSGTMRVLDVVARCTMFLEVVCIGSVELRVMCVVTTVVEAGGSLDGFENCKLVLRFEIESNYKACFRSRFNHDLHLSIAE
jgi:hypothetical protein